MQRAAQRSLSWIDSWIAARILQSCGYEVGENLVLPEIDSISFEGSCRMTAYARRNQATETLPSMVQAIQIGPQESLAHCCMNSSDRFCAVQISRCFACRSSFLMMYSLRRRHAPSLLARCVSYSKHTLPLNSTSPASRGPDADPPGASKARAFFIFDTGRIYPPRTQSRYKYYPLAYCTLDEIRINAISLFATR